MITISGDNYKNIIDKLHDAIIVIDSKLNILFLNTNYNTILHNSNINNLKEILTSSSFNDFSNKTSKISDTKTTFNVDCINKTSFSIDFP